MRIPKFTGIVMNTCEPHILKECSLVVDAQNFFYDCYKNSGLRFEYGAECDQYAKYLKDYLTMFVNSNVKCYFIFKGGTSDLEQKIFKTETATIYEPNLIAPIFMTDIHLQVLREMQFDYIFSEYESKPDCISLAHKLSCPVVSRDIEFALSGVQYVSKDTLRFNKNGISCQLFTLKNFIQKYKLNKNKVAMFILLSDQNIFLPGSFDDFLKSKHISIDERFRNNSLLRFLSKTSEQLILKDIFIYRNKLIGEDQILEKLSELKRFVRTEVSGGFACKYLLNKQETTDWFATGVAFQHIAKMYVDIYRSKELFVQEDDSGDFMKLSLGIIKYAYDLLTGFKNESFKWTCFLRNSNTKQSIVIRNSIKTPECVTDLPIFGDGWDNVHSLGLFQHFINEEIDFDCNKLKNLPDDCKLLMITLIYAYRKSNLAFTIRMAHVILLCYVAVNECIDSNNNTVTTSDTTTLNTLNNYFKGSNSTRHIDTDILNPLLEFQYCLSHMNYLNTLCGSPFKQTIYSRTYNGTFVYNALYEMKNVDGNHRILKSISTVNQLFNRLTEVFIDLVQ